MGWNLSLCFALSTRGSFDSATYSAFASCFAFGFALGAGTVAAAAREAASACSLRDPFSSSMPSSWFVSMPLRDLNGPCTSTLSFPTLLAQAHRDAASGQESCAHCAQLGVWLRKSVNYREGNFAGAPLAQGHNDRRVALHRLTHATNDLRV